MILDENVIALFLFRVSSPYWKNRYLDIRKGSVRSPSELSARVETYSGLAHTLVYFDRDNTKWFKYYLNGDGNIGPRWAVSQLSND